MLLLEQLHTSARQQATTTPINLHIKEKQTLQKWHSYRNNFGLSFKTLINSNQSKESNSMLRNTTSTSELGAHETVDKKKSCNYFAPSASIPADNVSI